MPLFWPLAIAGAAYTSGVLSGSKTGNFIKAAVVIGGTGYLGFKIWEAKQ